MNRALHHGDRAFRVLARNPVLVLTWWLSTLPLLGASYGLVRRALEHGFPQEAGDLMVLLLWSCLLVLTWAWYLLGSIFLHQQARAGARSEPVPPLPSLRRLLDQFPATAAAHAARTGLTAAALLPLAAGLPFARIATAPWPVRACLGAPAHTPGESRWPSLGVAVTQVLAWSLMLMLTANMAVLLGWLTQGTFLDAAALLPRLSDPRLWAVGALLSLSLVEPWRALALVYALGLDHSPREAPAQEPPC